MLILKSVMRLRLIPRQTGFLWSTLVVLCLASPMMAQGQDTIIGPAYRATSPDRASAIKLGLLKGHLYFGYLAASFEHEINRHWSAQLDVGCLPFNPNGHQYADFLGLGLQAEGRYYFALRKRPLEGFYLGPHAGFNYNTYYRYTTLPFRSSHGKWGQVGMTLGFQKSFFQRLLVGAGVKGGYSGSIHTKYIGLDGTTAGKFVDPQPVSIYLAFTFGYKF